jgi:hypothetical protein
LCASPAVLSYHKPLDSHQALGDISYQYTTDAQSCGFRRLDKTRPQKGFTVLPTASFRK